MRRSALLATASLIAHAAYAASPAPSPCPSGAPSYAASAGGFGVIDGQWYSPNGSVWVPHGINVMYFGSAPSAADILAKFPGTNFVRLALYNFPAPSQIQSVVNDYTSHGIFVLLDQHSSSDGQNRGGGTGSIFSGALLQQDLAWYTAMGKAFANNPYVGAASTNEPPASDPAALSDWQKAEYDAFRQYNNNPFWLEANAWADVNSINQGYKASNYANMTNVGWDFHVYPWLFDTGSSASQDQAKIAQYVANAQTITSGDGKMPVNILEGGNSTTGASIDSNGDTTVQAITNSPFGYAAWAWGSGGPGDGLLNNATQYPAMVAAYAATSGSTGCVESPIAVGITTPTAADRQTGPLDSADTAAAATDAAAGINARIATTLAGSPSLADVAQLAAQAGTTSGQSVSNVAQLAAMSATGADPGGNLQATGQAAAAFAGWSDPSTQLPIRSVPAPTGTMPTPDPVTQSGAFSATGDFEVMAAPASNNSITISGTGDSVNATGGVQTVSIIGPGNTLTTGPYNDTVTLTSSGNTIDTGGGNDTVVLAYKGQTPSSTINLDAPAVAPIGSAGNTIILPPPGTGTVTIRGTLAANDRLDLSKALAGTLWNGQQSTLWNHVTAATSPQGCTISVGGKVIALIPNGSPNGNIGPFVEAKSR